MRQLIIILSCISVFMFISCEIQEPQNVLDQPGPVDSDGDGWSDSEEADYFNPASNPYLFNPQIADYPQLEVSLNSVPAIGFYSSQGESITVTRGTETARVNTMGSSYTSTVSSEITISEEANFSLDDFGFSTTYEASLGFEMSNTWSSEQSQENRQTAETARDRSSELNGGSLAVAVILENKGNLDLILKSLQLSLLIIDPTNPQLFIPFGNLQLESGFSSESSIHIPPKSASGEGALKYSTDLSLDDTFYLAEHSSGLIINVAGANVSTVKDLKEMAFQQSTIFAKTATIRIDYGRNLNNDDFRRPREEYKVAANKSGSSLKEILEDILYMKNAYQWGEDMGHRGITSIRGVQNNSAANAHWFIVQRFRVLGESNQIIYDIQTGSYDPSEILIYPGPGNEIDLLYVSDFDKDGLYDNQEYALGSNNKEIDSDDDGMKDKDEYFTRWMVYVTGKNPYLVHRAPGSADFDGDGLTDSQEQMSRTDPYRADTDDDGVSDYQEIQPPITDPLNPMDY